MNHFEILPLEIIYGIFDNLDIEDISTMKSVSKDFNTIVNDNEIWKDKIEKYKTIYQNPIFKYMIKKIKFNEHLYINELLHYPYEIIIFHVIMCIKKNITFDDIDVDDLSVKSYLSILKRLFINKNSSNSMYFHDDYLSIHMNYKKNCDYFYKIEKSDNNFDIYLNVEPCNLHILSNIFDYIKENSKQYIIKNKTKETYFDNNLSINTFNSNIIPIPSDLCKFKREKLNNKDVYTLNKENMNCKINCANYFYYFIQNNLIF